MNPQNSETMPRTSETVALLGVLVEDECLLLRIVREDGGGRDVGRVGHFAAAHVVESALEEHHRRDVGDGLAGRGLLPLAAADRAGFGHDHSLTEPVS